MKEPTKRFTNRDLAAIFRMIADLLEIKGENIYKILAYRKAADNLDTLGEDILTVWQEDRLQTIPGIGKAIAEKIDELITTGQLHFLEDLEQEVPLTLVELLRVPDVGPRKAALFWREAGITNLAELEAAAREGKLRHLPGIGEKSEARILAGIEALARRTTRTPLGSAWPAGTQLRDWLRSLPGLLEAETAGSLRRMRATIGDIDLVAATHDPQPIMDAFVNHPRVIQVLAQGITKSSVEFDSNLRAQLWLYPPEQYGTALLYATGSKDHNVHLRELAQTRRLSLTDHSIIQPDGKETFYATEAEVYHALGMPWIPPELREDHGEIEAALKNQLPHLIEQKDILAELHCHTTWSDGQMSVREMALAARERGLKILAITDHSPSLGIAGGMKAEALSEQRAEIDQVQKELGDSIHLLQGAEVDILADGSLDYPDEVLAKLDIVIASLHSGLRQPRETVTRRVLSAIRNPHVDVIGHLTGRLIPEREGADLDMQAVLAAAREAGVALEINANPARLDLEDIYARRAVEMGILLSINTDAHHPDQMDLLHYGVAAARRGWVEPQDVINTWPFARLREWLSKRGS